MSNNNLEVDASEFLKVYPHIFNKITASWGSPNCRELLVSLINDSREGSRAGFSPQHAKTIFALLQRHDRLYSEFDTSNQSFVPFGFTAAERGPKRAIETQTSGNWGIIKAIMFSFVALLVVVAFQAYKFFS
ncbi:MAG: hypothetical protein WCI39_09600 [Gallionellaceae bacterium]